ncbi:rho GTPase-activating protein 12-like [Sinocyclocheilus anshuiensis]|uniref:rho GTPase-activating protein 12-like n=1 Tax=Sinocyclocheilus anshuiensis TaxID=1608454 RepID=UPI0007BA0C4E|nr:PREDICTED: rho GTPase-activating protein 12-like [Sinocyclocheilus anshuiensis]
MADRSVAPGQMYIEVEYDYEYKSKDRVIIIKQGESYLLVKKTNEDWWQVRKDEVSKAFYVPAQYVREVRRALMPPPKPLSAAGRGGTGPIRPSGLEIQRPDESKKSLCPSPSGNALLTPNDDRGSPGSPTAHVPPTQMNTLPGSLPRSRAKSPSRNVDGEKDKDKELEKSSRGPEKGAIHEEFAREGGGLDKNRNDSESGDDLSSGSTDNLQTLGSGQGRPDSPVYINLQELKIFQSSIPPLPSSSPFHTNGDWETHKDQNGRHFYYNCSTQERTWKPPRARDSLTRKEEKQDMTDTEVLSSEENCLSSQSDSQYGSPPRGWSEEIDEHGHTLYVSDYTNEKWLRHTDEQGRLYYYSADGSRSEWELPKIGLKSQSNHSPLLPGDAHKTRSLDRRLPDFIPMRPRHSVYLHESNDKDTKTGSPDSDSSCPSSPKPSNASSEKCGNLNMTKITEHGKKVRKNWTSYWTVLQGSSLLFNKGQGGGTGWFGREQKLEFSVELKGGSVDWASKDKSSKKHVLELKTRQGMELLLQSDNDSLISEWHKALTEAIHTYAWESDEAIEEDMPEMPDYKQKVQAVKDLMKQLPRPNHDTIQALFKHLKKVIQHVDENRMTTQSVAIVFGPTLLRPEVETANMAIHMVYQNQIVELILMEYEKIFGR